MRLQIVLKDLVARWEYSEKLREVIESILNIYNGEPMLPWAGFIAMETAGCSGEEVVGMCAFKTVPVNNRVEIICRTFPEYEGTGVATKMTELLMKIARRANPNITLIARTVPEESAAVTILKKHGFVNIGTVTDPEGSAAWEWVLDAIRN